MCAHLKFLFSDISLNEKDLCRLRLTLRILILSFYLNAKSLTFNKPIEYFTKFRHYCTELYILQYNSEPVTK